MDFLVLPLYVSLEVKDFLYVQFFYHSTGVYGLDPRFFSFHVSIGGIVYLS